MGSFLKRNDTHVALAMLAIWAAGVVYAYWNAWSIDMSALYMAGRFYWLGEYAHVYAAPPDFFSKDIPDRWATELTALGHDGEFPVPFVYPPIWAALAAPFAGTTDPMTFYNATRIPMLACFAGSIFVAWRLMAPRGLSATAFAAISIVIASLTIPFQFSASLNQPQFLIVFLILLAFERYGAGKSTTAGILLGLVAAIKISPVLLALIFVADRDWRALAATALTSGGIALLSLGLAGPDLHLAFLEKLRQIEGLVPLIGFNMNFETFMYDFFVPLQDYALSRNKLLGIDTPWVSLAAKALLPLALLGILRVTRTLDPATRLKLRVLMLYTTIVWFGPIAWMHYYTLPLLLAPALIVIWPPRAVMAITGLMTLGFSSALMMGLVNWSLDRGAYDLFYPQHTALFPLMALMAALVIWCLRQSRAAPDAPLSASPAE